ncbi:exopolysaccharide biosynthesis protein EpsF [Sphingomonas sp. JC676]|uniref:Wzz/FepE/Etk N-terminal domain-containing protein n=1 Tax=Sphingomonas sp. JC676 TaxID=2768065 RepID=UPI0016581C5D|nr:Wzz/FepE/Etk N-terminal domain-containing protein [Sphingomonas sp. JC676]MBC9032807.1 exopolysaccharide biosynthesis protein EpsF [Sphingomonas sp. JC676]
MSLVQFFRILWARRWIILPAFLVCVATAAIVSQFLPQRYRASTRVVLDTFKPDPVTGQVMSSQFMRAYTQTQIELIEDYRTAGRVVDALGWVNDPGNIAAFNASSAAASGDIRRWLAQNIIANTKAGIIEGSNILEISYIDTTAERAEQIANLVRKAFLEESLAYKRDAANKSAAWYALQADSARKALTEAEDTRTAFAKANDIVLTSANTDLDTQKLEQLEGQSVAAQSSPTMSAPSGGMGPAAIQLAAIDQQLEQAATTLGPNHPMFQSLQRQRVVVAAAAAREKSAGGASSVVNVGAIRNAANAQKSQVIAKSEKLDQLVRLQRDVELKKEQFLKASSRVGDLRLEGNSDDAGMTTLGEATAPENPYFPNVPLIVGGAAGFGLGLGVLIALLVELLGRRVRSTEDLELAVGAPVFGVIQTGFSLPSRLRRGYQAASESAATQEVAAS